MKKIFSLISIVIFVLVFNAYTQAVSQLQAGIMPILPVHRIHETALPRTALDVTLLKQELGTRGIMVDPKFSDSLVVKIYAAFEAVPEATDLHLYYEPRYFTCAGLKVVLGCFSLETRKLRITDKITPTFWATAPRMNHKYGFEFVLLHETAHSLGIVSEQEADKFAIERLQLIHSDGLAKEEAMK